MRASLAGSIIGNALLVLGRAMLIGGWRYRRQRFSRRVAGQYAAMILLVCYAAYIAYSVFGVRASHTDMLTSETANLSDKAGVPHDTAHASALAGEAATQRRQACVGPLATLAVWWRTTLWLPIVVLAGVTAVTAVVSEVLVGTLRGDACER